ncbi:MAG: stage V sporulation protein D (sporulation-specific penicillin-binding protein) [Candidatus Paceibacteria bacterium]|jgi:stage V sporulation protein D (sporulation-specific penicillin-binding protein)
MNKRQYTKRLRVVSFGIIVLALLIIGKLFLLQIVKGESYKARAERSYVQSVDTFERGSIFFSKKSGDRISAGTVTSGFRVVMNTGQIEFVEEMYQRINTIIEIDKDSFFRKANKENDPHEVIVDKITKTTADKIEALELPGVRMERQKWRFYPGGQMAAHALGFVAYKGDDRVGQYGLERVFNSVLSRKEDELYVNFFAEVFSGLSATFSGEGKEGDVVTTIEPNVQAFLEQQLDTLDEKWKSDASGGIIVNPKTGEILAMAYTPTFDLNNFSSVPDSSVFINPLIEHVFEFGSIIKPLVMAIGIEKGVVTAETTYYDAGTITVGQEKISNYDKKGRGTINMQEVLNQSLNTGMVFIQQKIGKKDFREYMKAYGLGEKTGIELPNEAAGLIANLDSSRDIEHATASFGQGIAFNPVVAIRAFSALANGGTLINPYLVKEIDYKDGGSKKTKVEEGKRVITKEASEEVTRMLVELVDTALFAGREKLERHTIAGKTGTAQVAAPDGGYLEGQNLHTFFGYAPAYDPEFLVLFFTKYPKGVRYASQTVAPASMETMKFLLQYYEVPPDR